MGNKLLDGLSSGPENSGTGNSRSTSGRSVGNPLQSCRYDPITWGSGHGRRLAFRRDDSIHQHDRSHCHRRSKRQPRLASSVPRLCHSESQGSVGISPLGDLTAGVGLTVPFGSITRWPDNGPFRNTTTFNTLPILDIKPTLAYKLIDDLSFGLGIDIYTFSGGYSSHLSRDGRLRFVEDIRISRIRSLT